MIDRDDALKEAHRLANKVKIPYVVYQWDGSNEWHVCFYPCQDLQVNSSTIRFVMPFGEVLKLS